MHDIISGNKFKISVKNRRADQTYGNKQKLQTNTGSLFTYLFENTGCFTPSWTSLLIHNSNINVLFFSSTERKFEYKFKWHAFNFWQYKVNFSPLFLWTSFLLLFLYTWLTLSFWLNVSNSLRTVFRYQMSRKSAHIRTVHKNFTNCHIGMGFPHKTSQSFGLFVAKEKNSANIYQ